MGQKIFVLDEWPKVRLLAPYNWQVGYSRSKREFLAVSPERKSVHMYIVTFRETRCTASWGGLKHGPHLQIENTKRPDAHPEYGSHSWWHNLMFIIRGQPMFGTPDVRSQWPTWRDYLMCNILDELMYNLSNVQPYNRSESMSPGRLLCSPPELSPWCRTRRSSGQHLTRTRRKREKNKTSDQ